MEITHNINQELRTLRGARRAAAPRASMVTTRPLLETGSFPLLIEPALDGLSLLEWAAAHVRDLQAMLLEHGALLFRGFDVREAQAFQAFATAVAGSLLDYRERAAPRREVAGRIYTSTAYPAHQIIPLHHEMSYASTWPAQVFFFCAQPPGQGGCTPIADDRRLLPLIPPAVRDRFERDGVIYVRNYGEGLDMTWQEVFQTTSRAEAEDYCTAHGLAFEWLPGDRLRTRHARPATLVHPATGEVAWFNHAHLFHISSVVPEAREWLMSRFASDELPRNVFYGDGSPIADDDMDAIRSLYEREAVRFAWQPHDILWLDNVRTAHGREAFSGPREILVALTGSPQA